jgi:hypothetical protein
VSRRRFLSHGLALSVLGFAGALRAEPQGLPAPLGQLLDEFRKSPGFSANFVEEKRILLLKEPVTNEGRMYFMRPRTFARWVDRPFPSQVLLDGRRITLTEGNTSRVIDLDAQPSVRALVGGFLALLEGDASALSRDYHVRFEATAEESWRVVLIPKGPPIDRLLGELSFTGRGIRMSTMTWVEKTGDTSTTRFSNVEVGRVFSEAEKRRFFSSMAKQ